MTIEPKWDKDWGGGGKNLSADLNDSIGSVRRRGEKEFGRSLYGPPMVSHGSSVWGAEERLENLQD